MQQNKAKTPGGIDLNPDLLTLETEGDFIEIDWSIDQLPVMIYETIGVQPVIINITPIYNPYPLLGLSEIFEDELSNLRK